MRTRVQGLMPDVGRPFPFVELLGPGDGIGLLVLCDHAGRELPTELGDLGVAEADLARHIGWDIGAAEVARGLARHLGAAAVLDHCCRLVIDPNRRPWTPTSIPTVSDGTPVPGNRDLSPAEVRRRIGAYFLPYHRTIARLVAGFRRRGRMPVILAVHSFTPRLNGSERPWQAGVLWRGDRRVADPLLAALRAAGDAVIGDNEPYSGLEEFGFTVEFHCQRGRLPHAMVELRQDAIAMPEGVVAWSARLAAALRPILAERALYAAWAGPLAERQPWRAPRGLMELR